MARIAKKAKKTISKKLQQKKGTVAKSLKTAKLAKAVKSAKTAKPARLAKAVKSVKLAKKPKVAKKPKAVKSTKVRAGSAIRRIAKLELSLLKDQAQLGKLYAKSLTSTEKAVKKLSAQLQKLHKKTSADARPARGRKPAQNAVQLVSAQLDTAMAEQARLAVCLEKFAARQDALSDFEKSFQKKAAAASKSESVKTRKSRKTAQFATAADDAGNLHAEVDSRHRTDRMELQPETVVLEEDTEEVL